MEYVGQEIQDEKVKVMQSIDVELNPLNDYGQFLHLYSNAPDECEQLLTFGSNFQITEMFPGVLKGNEIVKMKDYFDKDLDEKQL